MADSLHEHAVEAGRHLSALSTGLTKAGAPDEVVTAVSECEDVVRKVSKVLGSPEPNPPEANVSPEQGPMTPAPEKDPGVKPTIASAVQDHVAQAAG